MKAIRYFSLLLSLIVLLGFHSCKAQDEGTTLQKDLAPESETVLFVGNSHTYYNQGLATHLLNFRSADDPTADPLIQEVAKGGYTLEDHLHDPTTLAKLRERDWDFVIFQENTAVASETLESTTDALRALTDLVAQSDAQILLYMTWPYKERPEMLQGIRKTYEAAAAALQATLVPVGEHWLSLDQSDEIDLEFYNPDGIHASLEGTFYASSLFYKIIYGKSPSQNPYTAGLPKEIADYLKSKAE